ALGTLEQAARGLLALRDERRHGGQAAVVVAEHASGLEGRPHDRIRLDERLGPQQRARAVLARRQQPRLAQRLALARHLRLTLTGERRELADRQLVCRAE